MSLNKKWGFLFGSAAALFLTIAMVCILNLYVYPGDDDVRLASKETTAAETSMYSEELGDNDDETAYGAETEPEDFAGETLSEAETESVVEETLSEADPRVMYAKYFEQTIQTAHLIRSTAWLATILAILSILFMVYSAGRGKCPEGVESNLLALALFAAFAVNRIDYYSQFSSCFSADPTGKITVYGTVTGAEAAVIFVACVCGVWSLWTLISWCRQRLSIKWSILYKITEKASERKNGSALLVLIPEAAFCFFMTAAVVTLLLMCFVGVNAFWILLFLFLCEAAVCMRVLVASVRQVRKRQDEIIEQVRVSERMRVDLIANVSHDLRTPLTSIIGFGELLEDEELSETGRKHLNKVNEKSRYLRDMVDEVFALAKVSSGVDKCRQDKIDLIRLLEQTVGDYEEVLKSKGFEVKRHYAEEHLIILSDGVFLHQIFSNLLSNAIKYTLPGTRIHLEVNSDDAYLMVRMLNVASYEMKFTEKEIVERFARGDESRNTEGNGLGLAIANTYSEALGGSFQVEVDGDQFAAIVKLPASVRIL